MNEPAVFGTNEQHPFYFDDSGRPEKILPLKCPLKNTVSKYDNPPYETWSSYVYNFAEAACFFILFFAFFFDVSHTSCYLMKNFKL